MPTEIDDDPAPAPSVMAAEQLTVTAARPELVGVGDFGEEREAAARTRHFRMGDAEVNDNLHIDPNLIPPGQSWEWKRVSTFGKPDSAYNVRMRQQGWLPVDPRKYPSLVEPGHTGPIIRDGLMLCERPIELTREAQEEERIRARGVMLAKQAELGRAPPGQFPREGGSAGARIGRSIEQGMPIE